MTSKKKKKCKNAISYKNKIINTHIASKFMNKVIYCIDKQN